MQENKGLSTIRQLLTLIGEDPAREGLQETPARVVKAWEVWAGGYGLSPKDVLKEFKDGAEGYDEMVFQGAIPFYSHCEHHLAPFFGYAHVAYIPKGKIVGLSKLARLVDIFARRLQVQERMGKQIADALTECLEPLGAAVVLQARHMCMESRGVKITGTVTVTSALRGNFKDQPEVRAEFISLVQTAMQGVKTL
jgi:GTP cyclohydrolase I